MWHLTNWKPFGTFLLSSRSSNATHRFYISLAMALAQKVDPVYLSMAKASSAYFDRGSQSGVFWGYLTLNHLTSEMIVSCFLRTQNIHHLKLGWRATPIWIANSATCTGCDSFRLDSFAQVVEPSFHLQQMNLPFVDLSWQVVPFTVSFFEQGWGHPPCT